MKKDIRLSLKHQLYKCIYSWSLLLSNRRQVAECVYLASMGVKIEHTVGSQNQDFFKMPVGHARRNMGHNQCENCENLCFCPSKLI